MGFGGAATALVCAAGAASHSSLLPEGASQQCPYIQLHAVVQAICINWHVLLPMVGQYPLLLLAIALPPVRAPNRASPLSVSPCWLFNCSGPTRVGWAGSIVSYRLLYTFGLRHPSKMSGFALPLVPAACMCLLPLLAPARASVPACCVLAAPRRAAVCRCSHLLSLPFVQASNPSLPVNACPRRACQQRGRGARARVRAPRACVVLGGAA